MRTSKQHLAALTLMGLAATGCSAGSRYIYRGQVHTMTQASIEYHRKAIAEVQSKCGDPRLLADAAKLEAACTLLRIPLDPIACSGRTRSLVPEDPIT